VFLYAQPADTLETVREPFWEGRARNVTDAAILHDSNEPPVAVAIVEEDHCISLCCVGLSINRGDKIVKSVDEFEINIFYSI
jgi:hypothetical protein